MRDCGQNSWGCCNFANLCQLHRCFENDWLFSREGFCTDSIEQIFPHFTRLYSPKPCFLLSANLISWTFQVLIKEPTLEMLNELLIEDRVQFRTGFRWHPWSVQSPRWGSEFVNPAFWNRPLIDLLLLILLTFVVLCEWVFPSLSSDIQSIQTINLTPNVRTVYTKRL